MRIILPLFLLLSISLNAQQFGNGFQFYMPPGDSTAQRFLPGFAKQPITNFVGIDASGHFQAGGQRLRFWGTNMIEGACFLRKPKPPGLRPAYASWASTSSASPKWTTTGQARTPLFFLETLALPKCSTISSWTSSTTSSTI
ncbi:MAG: hypothetical protein IPN76_18505 [Saprospiraceae bacterium]|nr:hypothetical protein [Saprospiraceae bacterium]